jgi:hypothetical protein
MPAPEVYDRQVEIRNTEPFLRELNFIEAEIAIEKM